VTGVVVAIGFVSEDEVVTGVVVAIGFVADFVGGVGVVIVDAVVSVAVISGVGGAKQAATAT
jgi:hypothetical protein